MVDFGQLKMSFLGPADYDLARSFPPGTRTFQCERAPSGHMVIPCSEFEGKPADRDGNLALAVTREDSFSSPPPLVDTSGDEMTLEPSSAELQSHFDRYQ